MRRPSAPPPPFSFLLEPESGIPVYRQLVDQVLGAIASGRLSAGDQLPTVRGVAVDLSINPNTVARAYRELEVRGALATQQGIGTFVTADGGHAGDRERQRRLDRLAADTLARAGAGGFTADELLDRLQDFISEHGRRS